MTQAEETLIERWGKYFPETDLKVLAEAGYGRRMGFGESPALLIVDVTYEFCGIKSIPVLEATRQSRRSCGERAWDTIPAMREVLDAARIAGIPVIFSTQRGSDSPAFEAGLWGAKNWRSGEDYPNEDVTALNGRVVDEIKPIEGELVLAKNKPSVFHGTGLVPYLVSKHVDSLIIFGGATSGCVYASAVDAFSYNFKTTVVADASFDRVDTPHWASLLDIDMKYGDVLSSQEVVEHLKSIRAKA